MRCVFLFLKSVQINLPFNRFKFLAKGNMQKLSPKGWAASFLPNPSVEFARGKISLGFSPRTLMMANPQFKLRSKRTGMVNKFIHCLLPFKLVHFSEGTNPLLLFSLLPVPLYGSLYNFHLADVVLEESKLESTLGLPESKHELASASQNPNKDKKQVFTAKQPLTMKRQTEPL